MAERPGEEPIRIEPGQLTLTFVGYRNGADSPMVFCHNGQTIPLDTYRSMDLIDATVLRALCADIIAGIDEAREMP